MAKKDTSEWKHEVARAERRSRLARMKGTDGHKKKIESHTVWKKVTLSILAGVLVLAILVWVVAMTGILTKSMPAMTVAGRKLTAAELNMVMGNMTASEQYGLAFTEEFQKILDQPSQLTPGGTVREDIINQMMPGAIFMYAALSEIEHEQFMPDEEEKAEIEKNVEALKNQFAEMAQTSGRSVNNLIKMYYGPGVTIRMVERDLRNAMIINFYEDRIREEADLSDEEVEAYYQEHKDSLDLFSYKAYSFKPELAEDATADEKAAALDQLEKKAEEALADLGELTFKEAILKQVSEEEAAALEEDPESLVFKKERPGDFSFSIHEFIKGAGVKPGDAKVIREVDAVTLVEFTGRVRDNFEPYTVRHILIADRDGEGESAKTDEELKEEAEQVLNEFLEGDRSEELFVKLVVVHSKDPGSVSNGGLYEDVAAGTMVAEFEKWATEDGRKKGDTGIIKTAHGYHVMYYVGSSGEAELPGRIRAALKEIHLADWVEGVSEEAEVIRYPFGMKFVGKLSFFDALLGAPPTEPSPTPPRLEP